MNSLESIKSRFQFSIPNDYLRLWHAGVLANDRESGIKLSRHKWLGPEEIADCPWPNYKIGQLIPCARTPGGDHYCWYVQPSGDVFIAECPRDSDFADAFSPDFEGFFFRSLLEEFNDTWLVDDFFEASKLFNDYAQRVRGVLRKRWEEILLEYADQKPILNRWNRPQVISDERLSSIIRTELDFPGMGKQFRQHVA
jgi:hypothetical protein